LALNQIPSSGKNERFNQTDFASLMPQEGNRTTMSHTVANPPSVSQSILENALGETLNLLNEFANRDDFSETITSIFGQGYSPNSYSIFSNEQAATPNAALPTFEILSSSLLQGAHAAFASETNTIYLSEDFLITNISNTQAITAVLLEEIGHYIDSQLNYTDTPGDEGAIFSATVQGKGLSATDRTLLNAEIDTFNLLTPSGTITAEASIASEANLGLIGQYIDDSFDAILKSVATAGLDTLGVPLVSNLNLASYVSRLVSDTLKQGLVNELQSAGYSDGNNDATDVRQGLFTVLNGLGILRDSDGNNLLDINDIGLSDTINSTEYQFKIGQKFSESQDLSQALSIPGLGLDVKGKASVNLDLSLDMNLGVDETVGNGAFFLKTSNADELKAEVDINLKDAAGNPLSFDATLGFLNAKVTDNGTEFKAGLNVDLNTNSADANRVRMSDFGSLSATPPLVNAGLDFKFKLDTGISTDGQNKNGILPSIQADFVALNTIGGNPDIAFKNVTLDAGSFVKNFAGEVLETVQKVTGPINPVIKTITKPLPVVNDSLVGLAETFLKGSMPPGTAGFINQIGKVTELVKSVSTAATGKIQLGDFQVTGGGAINQTQAPGQSVANQLSTLGTFFNQLNDPVFGGALAFPLLSDPSSAIKLLVGDPSLELFSYTTPQLGFKFDYEAPPIPIFGPIALTFGAGAGAKAQLKFGFDSHGLEAFRDGGFTNPDLIFDGFYASRPDAPDTPNIGLYGELTAEAGVNLGFVSLGVGGGIRLSNNLSLYDPTDPVQPFKVRGSRITTIDSPACLFQAQGKLEAFVFAEFELDLGIFSFSKRLNLADINLIDVVSDPDCPGQKNNVYDQEEPDKSDEIKEILRGQGFISYEDTAGRNHIILEDEGGSKGKEDVLLILEEGRANETRDKYVKVKNILIEGRDGDDYIQFRDDLDASGDIQGGEGNDTIIGGDGNDYISGGQGNDMLNGGGDKDYVSYVDVRSAVVVSLEDELAINDGYGTQDQLENIENIEGSKFSDLLTGNSSANVLDGGAGDDTLNGLGGDDIFVSGAGADRIDGGSGLDGITYVGSREAVWVNLNGTTSNGGDAQGDVITNLERLQGSMHNDRLLGHKGDNYLDGFMGDDTIKGSLGDDTIDGGVGVDTLSYASLTQGIKVDLKTGETDKGDEIKLVSYLNADGEQVDIPGWSSIENLEGTLFDDVLNGDINNNRLIGLAGADNLSGYEGNDTIIGGAGADTIDGGVGVDWLDYSDSAAGVRVDLNTGLAQGGDAEGDVIIGIPFSLSSIEHLRGSDSSDKLVGTIDHNIFAPGLSTRTGDILANDIVDGGLGNDRLVVDYSRGDSGTGVVGGYRFGSDHTGFLGRNTINNNALLDGVGFVNIEVLEIRGTTKGDTLYGGKGDDLLLPGAGNDYIFGGYGSNTILADDGNDIVIDQSDLNQSISNENGKPASSFINLDGGRGIDRLSINLSGKDREGAAIRNISIVSFDPSQENVNQLISFSDGSRISGFEIFQDVITGDGNDTIIQLGRVDNRFNAGMGNDTINAGLGRDRVDGGTTDNSDDWLVVDYSVEDVGTGIFSSSDNNGPNRLYRNDSRGSILDEVEFSNIGHLHVTGTRQADQVMGSFLGDILSGNGGNDQLSGNNGNDILNGGDGNDRLTGAYEPTSAGFNPGSGEIDWLTGGVGADTFVVGNRFSTFYVGQGFSDAAIITDFNPLEGDILQLSGSASDYQVAVDPINQMTGVYYRGDLVTVLQNTTSLDLNAAYIRYDRAGRTPLFPVDFATRFMGQRSLGLTHLEATNLGSTSLGVPNLLTTFSSTAPLNQSIANFADDLEVSLSRKIAPIESPDIPPLEPLPGDGTFAIQQNNDPTQLLNTLTKPGTMKGLSNVELEFEGDARAVGIFENDPFGLGSGIVLSTGKVKDLVGKNTSDGGFSPGISVPLKFTKLQNTIGGTGVFVADLSNIGFDIKSISFADSGSFFGGASGPFSGFDLDAIQFSRTLINDAALVTSLPSAPALNGFDFSPAGTFFTPGTQRSPVTSAMPELFGTTNGFINNGIATLGTFDALNPLTPGFMSLGDGGKVGFNLSQSVATQGQPLYLYVGEVSDNGETPDGLLTVSNRGIGGLSDLSTDFGAPGAIDDDISLKLTFDADATAENLYFQFVFGSEELVEYAGSNFNDRFSLSLNGFNMAQLSDGASVSINNLATRPTGSYHPDLVLNQVDQGSARDITKIDGFTKVLTFVAPLDANTKNTLEIKVQDGRDGLLDSAVFVRAGTFGSMAPPSALMISSASSTDSLIGTANDTPVLGASMDQDLLFAGASINQSPETALISEIDMAQTLQPFTADPLEMLPISFGGIGLNPSVEFPSTDTLNLAANTLFAVPT
jgi:Ca2+-binding RTX toxin-like protein